MVREPASVEAFYALASEVRRLFHQLAAAAEALHAGARGVAQPVSAAHRAVLESLWRVGPQTVPALARSRPVSRQHIQVLVNDLMAEGLIETQPNPAHRRSHLVALTAAGQQHFEAMHAKERAELAAARLPVTASEMRDATETLRRLRGKVTALAEEWKG